MITVAVTYVIHAGREAEAEAHLRAIVAATRREPGCRTFEANRSRDDARTFLLYEVYDDQAAIDAHQRTPHFEEHVVNGLRTMMESRTAHTFVPVE
jgi:quinol monooxygenase YgiN